MSKISDFIGKGAVEERKKKHCDERVKLRNIMHCLA